MFASRGYAVLALPYYSPPGWGANGPTPAELPSLPAAFADIPIDRLEQARAWLAQQPEVDASRIGVVGTSQGAEFALLAAVRYPWIKAVLAVVPSDIVWEGWDLGVQSGERASFSWQGQGLNFLPYKDFEKELAGFAVYPDAGHFLGGTGWGPTTQYNAGPSKAGGTPAANARAQAEAFPRGLQFLARVLGPVPAAKPP